MTVRELINRLLQFDLGAEVLLVQRPDGLKGAPIGERLLDVYETKSQSMRPESGYAIWLLGTPGLDHSAMNVIVLEAAGGCR